MYIVQGYIMNTIQVDGKLFKLVEVDLESSEFFIVTKFFDSSGKRPVVGERTRVFDTYGEATDYIEDNIGQYRIDKRYETKATNK